MKVAAIYSPTIMDGPVIRFQTGFNRGSHREIVSGKERTDWSAEINASRKGVSINGQWPVYSQPEDLAALAALVAAAWNAHADIKGARHDDHAVAKAIAERFNAKHAGNFVVPLVASPALPRHEHKEQIAAATSIRVDGCAAGHAVVLVLLDERDAAFADAHVPVAACEPLIESIRSAVRDLGGAQVGHG